ncbi:hypothetical protein EGM70_17160 [Enterobacteriaceae bacterium 89]|nr:hypothetical protein [Enterobacteriaceae bacterium 89]
MVVGRTLGNAEVWVNHVFAHGVCNLIYDDVNAETMYDTLFYIDLITVIAFTTVIYFAVMKLINKMRK